jgi:hypothetical protein
MNFEDPGGQHLKNYRRQHDKHVEADGKCLWHCVSWYLNQSHNMIDSDQVRDDVIGKFRGTGDLIDCQEADRLQSNGESGYPDDRSFRFLSELYNFNLAVYNTIVDPTIMSIYGSIGDDGNDPASLVLRHFQVADGAKHLSGHFDVIMHGTQIIQRPPKQASLDTPESINLGDKEHLAEDSQQSSSGANDEGLDIERLVDSRMQTDGDPSLRETVYLVKWMDYDSDENTWEPVKNLGNDASTLIKDLVREQIILKDWKAAIDAPNEASAIIIEITFVSVDDTGLIFRKTGNGKCFVFSIGDDSPALTLSDNKLEIGALLVNVNGVGSYNPDRMKSLCLTRPLTLTFLSLLESNQDDVLPDTSDSTLNKFAESGGDNKSTAWLPIHHPLGKLWSAPMQRITHAQKTTSSQSEIVRVGDFMADSMAEDLVSNGIYLISLGVSLSDWLRGIGCLTCLALLNHYNIFTVSELFDRGITDDSLHAIQSGSFGHFITPRQSDWIATASYGVYYVYDILSGIVDKIVNSSILHPEEFRTSPKYISDVLSSVVDQIVLQSVLHPEEFPLSSTLPVSSHLDTAQPVTELPNEVWTGDDVQFMSIEQEDSYGFPDSVSHNSLVNMIDHTRQHNMTRIVHSPHRLGLSCKTDEMVFIARHDAVDNGPSKSNSITNISESGLPDLTHTHTN